ncbi:uncharacterized protein NEMAJ01_1321 [Nematocida major]|uniref:uncharacterized protein n=1 Tax=Nematocida major TaxID=1912982 RepID=UPI0020085B69|nr:uncharacterized protein NEMAJ01_1321 [Nematocida major]KAH9386425.1 hypothetical protein NEMAJ01_1321 [Nematocida major]
MRANYTAEAIPYELDQDRSRCYMAPNGLREAHLKPGQHVKLTANKKDAFLKIIPKFDGDENAVYIPQEELQQLGARPGDAVHVERAREEFPEASEVCIWFKRVRKTIERLEAVRLIMTDKKVVSCGEAILGGRVKIKEHERVKVTDETKIKIETEERTEAAVGLEEEAGAIKAFLDGAHRGRADSLGDSGFCEGESEEDMSWRVPQGLILAGDPGMGKRTLCQSVLRETGKEWVRVHGNKTKLLEDAFEYAKLNEPCTIWIDRLDRYLEDRPVDTAVCIERLMEEVTRDGRRIAVLATVSDLQSVPKELTKAYVLDKAVLLHAPTLAQRAQQIQAAFTRHVKANPECAGGKAALESAAKRTAGFTRSEIHLLVRDSILESGAGLSGAGEAEPVRPLEQSIASMKISGSAQRPCNGQCMERLMSKIVRSIPSASDGVPAEVPNIRFSAIFGQEEAKERLKEAIIWPVVHSALFSQAGVQPPKGVLLYGPPGCGKTLIAQALANESGSVFLSIRGPEIMGKYVGESEERVRKVFARARAQTPSIVFIDEIDSIAPHRESEGGQVDKRVVSTLLTEMDGVGSAPGVFVLGATNKPWSIDSALMRPGRFDCHVLVDLPGKETRKELIRSKLGKTLQAIQAWGDMQEGEAARLQEYLAERSDGFTGAEISGLCAEISMGAVRARIQEVTTGSGERESMVEGLKKIADRVKPRVPKQEIETFRAFSMDPMKVQAALASQRPRQQE